MFSRTHIFLCVATLLLAVPSVSHAGEWEEAFDAETLAGHLPDDAAQVLLVQTGDHADSAAAVGRAMKRSLESVDTAAKMDVTTVNAPKQTDKAILRQWAQADIDAIVTLRVFEEDDAEPTAVVAVYAEGEPYSAFILRSGETLQPRDPDTVDLIEGSAGNELTVEDLTEGLHEQSAPSEGVTSETWDSIEETQDDVQKSHEERIDTFARGVLAVSFHGHPPDQTARGSTPTRFYRGADMTRISGIDFLEALGRDDLIEQYHQNQRHSRIGVSVSVGILGAGLVLGGIGLVQQGRCRPGDPRTCPSTATPFVISGGIMTFGGFLVGIGFAAQNPFPLEVHRAHELAEQHNQALKEKLELEEDVEFEPKYEKPQLEVGAGAVGNGAGLMLRGRF